MGSSGQPVTWGEVSGANAFELWAFASVRPVRLGEIEHVHLGPSTPRGPPTDSLPRDDAAEGYRGLGAPGAKRAQVSVDVGALAEIRAAALSSAPISLGVRRTVSPHEFYRYPARFSPELAAAVIEGFSSPGDLVADYFVGGGTTLVEARRAGRLAVGSDVNSLSVFVSDVKTRLYGGRDLEEVLEWSWRTRESSESSTKLPVNAKASTAFRNMTESALAPQRDFLLRGVAELAGVKSTKARGLARCILLRTAQWALDMRREVPDAEHLRGTLAENAQAMVATARAATREYRSGDASAAARGLPRSLVLHQGLPGVAAHPRLRKHPSPRLVLTSPPYPGVYVNYHRWKVRGRLETPFPYFLAGQSDGNGLAFYTMAARSDPSQRTYFSRLEAAFRDVARLCDEHTHLVQVVGFSNVEDHFARYLATMRRAGFSEVRFDPLATADDGRLWRDVPGRRWWARAGDRSRVVTHTAREVVLIHKLA